MNPLVILRKGVHRNENPGKVVTPQVVQGKVAVPKKIPGKVVRIHLYDTLSDKSKVKLLEIQTDIEEKIFNIKLDILSIGRLLSEAKKILKHGQFKQWIEKTWGGNLPYTTAHCYMAVYEGFKDYPYLVKTLPVSILLQMRQKTFPEEIRALIAKKTDAFKKSDLDAFKEACRSLKNGKINIGDFVKLAKKQIELGIRINNGDQLLRHSLGRKRTVAVGLNSLHKAILSIRKHLTGMINLFPPAEDLKKGDYYNSEYLMKTVNRPLLEKIDKSIEQLKLLRSDISQERQLFRTTLVEEEGIIKEKDFIN